MAELSVQIGADIRDLQKKLKLAEEEFKKLEKEAIKSGESIESVLDSPKGDNFKSIIDEAGSSIADVDLKAGELSNSFDGVNQAANNLKGGIGGIANQFKVVSAAATAGGAAMRAALISTGIGALVVALGLIVSNWESISKALFGANDQLDKQIAKTKSLIVENNHRLAILELEEKILINQGKVTDENRAKQKEVTLELIKQSKRSIEDLKTNLEKEKSLAFQLGWYDKILIATGQASSLDLVSPDEAKRINEINEELNETEQSLKKLELSLTETPTTELDKLIVKQRQLKDSYDNLFIRVGKDAEATIIAKKAYDELTKTITDLNDSTKAPTKGGEDKRIKQAEKDRALLVQIEEDLQNEVFEKAKEGLAQATAIYESFADEIEKTLKIDTDAILIGQGFAEILELEKIEKRIESIKTKFGSLTDNIDFSKLQDIDDFNILEKTLRGATSDISKIQNILDSLDLPEFDFKGLQAGEIDVLLDKLEQAKTTSQITGNAIGSAFSTMANEMAIAFETGNAIVDSFVGSLIQSLTQLLTDLLAQQIAQVAAQAALGQVAQAQESAIAAQSIATNTAVATGNAIEGATASAAATGPGAIFTLPTFIALAVGLVAAAFAALGSFAKGGFTSAEGKRDDTGFRVAGVVHEGEYVVPKKVLQTKAGAQMVNQLEDLRRFNKTSNNFNTSFATGGYTSNSFGGFTNSFASGGFTNIKNITSGIYNTMAISNLSNLSNRPISNNLSDGIMGEVILRGNNQVIQLRRSEKKMNRFYNS